MVRTTSSTPEPAKQDGPKSESHHERSKIGTIVGGIAAGGLVLRDRGLQTALIGTSLVKHWNEPPLAPWKEENPSYWRENKGKWRALGVVQLLAAEDSNDIVPPRGDLRVGNKTFTDFWHRGFRWNHGIQTALLPIMVASAGFNGVDALHEDGVKGVYDTRAGRAAAFATAEGGYLAYVMYSAMKEHRAVSAETGTNAGGIRGYLNSVIEHEGLGGMKLWVALTVCETALVANELGWMDFMGNKGHDENRPFWKVLLGIPG